MCINFFYISPSLSHFRRKWNYIAAKRVLRGNDDDEKGGRLRTWISAESEVNHRQHSIHIHTHSVALCIHIRFDWLWNFVRWWEGEEEKVQRENSIVCSSKSHFHDAERGRGGKKSQQKKNVMLIRRVNKIYHFSSSRFRARVRQWGKECRRRWSNNERAHKNRWIVRKFALLHHSDFGV